MISPMDSLMKDKTPSHLFQLNNMDKQINLSGIHFINKEELNLTGKTKEKQTKSKLIGNSQNISK